MLNVYWKECVHRVIRAEIRHESDGSVKRIQHIRDFYKIVNEPVSSIRFIEHGDGEIIFNLKDYVIEDIDGNITRCPRDPIHTNCDVYFGDMFPLRKRDLEDMYEESELEYHDDCDYYTVYEKVFVDARFADRFNSVDKFLHPNTSMSYILDTVINQYIGCVKRDMTLEAIRTQIITRIHDAYNGMLPNNHLNFDVEWDESPNRRRNVKVTFDDKTFENLVELF